MEDARPTHWRVPGTISLNVPVYLSMALSDRLEVPEQWQEHDSFDLRLQALLAVCQVAIIESPAGVNPVPFRATLQNAAVGFAETVELLARFDGEGLLIGFARDGSDA